MKALGAFALFPLLLAVASAIDLESVYTQEQIDNMDRSVLEDARLNFTGLASKYGYPSEVHTVTTRDGYVLTLHRIPYGKACGPGKDKIPVLLQHGLLSSSIDYIIMGPENGLGYILADECFDVWMGNSRGSRDSRRHLSLDVKNPKFWEFSWHEMGTEDVPALVDYVLDRTGQPNLHYVGYSQGTTQFFVFASSCPDYHRKVRSAYALSPVAFMKNIKSPVLRFLSFVNQPLHIIARLIGLHEFMPSSEFLNFLGMQICRDEYPAIQEICANVIFLLVGFNPEQLNKTMLPAIIAHTPAGSSTSQIVHYGQIITRGEFRKYDHGIRNWWEYGGPEPPRYDLANVHIPVSLFYSDNDWLSDVDDVHDLSKALPNVVRKFRVKHKMFNHVDFMWGRDVRKLVYDDLVNIMKRY